MGWVCYTQIMDLVLIKAKQLERKRGEEEQEAGGGGFI